MLGTGVCCVGACKLGNSLEQYCTPPLGLIARPLDSQEKGVVLKIEPQMHNGHPMGVAVLSAAVSAALYRC